MELYNCLFLIFLFEILLITLVSSEWQLMSEEGITADEGRSKSPAIPRERWKLTYGPPSTPEEEQAWKDRKIRYWTNAVIPYYIHCSIENLPITIGAIHRAMKEWEDKTCIRFVKYTNEKHYLRFMRDISCWGNVGVLESHPSQISVGPGCDFNHVMAHELGHAIGMWHEHNRKDRDRWVEVVWENVGNKSPFEKMKRNYRLDVEYDYESIMHYPWSAFSKNDNDTIKPTRERNGKVPYRKVSKRDSKLASILYGCPAIQKRRANEVKKFDDSFDNNFNAWGCIDREPRCELWQKLGYCLTREHVRKDCKRSCRDPICHGGHCRDFHPDCKTWAEIGHCKFVEIVQVRCQKSCNPFCQDCADKLATCKDLAKKGKCSQDESVRLQCKSSCNSPTCYVQKPVVSKFPRLETHDPRFELKWPNRNYLGAGRWCKDWISKCPLWARQGKCESNPKVMLRHCLRSCPKARCDDRMIYPPGRCSAPLGLSVDINGRFRLPDTAFSTDSWLKIGNWTARASNARLYFEDDSNRKEIGAWCSHELLPKYLQVDLQQTKTVAYIATQGRDKHFEYTWSFNIQFSEDGKSYKTYREDGKDRLFYGNCDHVTPTLNRFKNKFRARFIRYVPVGAMWVCVRMEFYGC